MLDKMYIKTKLSLQRAMHYLFEEEKGSSEVIALVVIIGIVLILGFIFKDEILKLFQSLWNKLVAGKSRNNANSVDLSNEIGN